MKNEKVGKIECFGNFKEEEIIEMQMRRVTADQCIEFLKNYRNYFNNHPNRNMFNRICDEAISQFFATDMIFDIDKGEIQGYLNSICQYIRDHWDNWRHV